VSEQRERLRDFFTRRRRDRFEDAERAPGEIARGFVFRLLERCECFVAQ
jgi:hypothetical protein